MQDEQRVELLKNYGFSHFEAVVYLELLKTSPQTGYKIAKSIQKTRSSTYLVLGNLEAKGAVTKLMGKDKQEYIPVGIREFIAHHEAGFLQQKKATIDAFKDLETPDRDDQIYFIKNTEELISRAKEMIRNASEIVLVDSETLPLNFLRSDLETAAQRGVKVIVERMGDQTIAGAEMIKATGIVSEFNTWNVDWLTLSADSEKTLIAYISKSGELIVGIWISNLYLSDWFFNGMFYEILMRHVINLFNTDLSKQEILSEIQNFHQSHYHKSNGFKRIQEMMNRFE